MPPARSSTPDRRSPRLPAGAAALAGVVLLALAASLRSTQGGPWAAVAAGLGLVHLLVAVVLLLTTDRPAPTTVEAPASPAAGRSGSGAGQRPGPRSVLTGLGAAALWLLFLGGVLARVLDVGHVLSVLLGSAYVLAVLVGVTAWRAEEPLRRRAGS